MNTRFTYFNKLFFPVLIMLFAASGLMGQAAGAGKITGIVKNDATGLFLRDASVEIRTLKRSTTSDELGRFEFSQVPFGEYEVVVNYMGLDTFRAKVSVNEGAPEAVIDASLKSEVYVLEKFVISGEREGGAAALTRQRMADNVKTVISLDSVGYLPNENPADLLVTLPGITGNIDENGEIRTVNIRGIDPELNAVTYDGAQMATSGGLATRAFRFLNITATSFEELEVIKAPTPDMSATSLGGTVNMKTKSTLNMKGDLLFTYRAGMKITPSFWNYAPRRLDAPIGPLFSLGYKQIFSIGGGRRNFGISLDLYHNEKIMYATRAGCVFSTETDSFKYRDYIRSFTASETVGPMAQETGTLRFDLKFSANSRMYFTAMYSQQGGMVPRGQEGISATYQGSLGLANYGDDSSSLYSNSAAGTLTLTYGRAGFMDRQSRLQIGGVQRLWNWDLEYDFSYSNSSVYLDGKSKKPHAGFALQSYISNVGGIIDRRNSEEFPTLMQRPGTAASKNFYDAENYSLRLIQQDSSGRDGTNYEGKINLKGAVSVFGHPVQLQSGVAWKQVFLEDVTTVRRWTYNKTNKSQFLDHAAKIDPRFGESVTRLPLFSLAMTVDDLYKNQTDWNYDAAYSLHNSRLSTRDVTEEVSAGYLMGRSKFGGLGVVAGVRYERVESRGNSWVPSSAGTVGDPNLWRRMHTENANGDFFPSVHLVYVIKPNLQARLSWSTSVGRPMLLDLIQTFSANTTEQLILISNPELTSQYGDSFDFAFEYYLKPVGLFSVGVFRKYISDFIYQVRLPAEQVPSGLFDPIEYSGYDVVTRRNGNKAVVDGIEFSYSQQLGFLPKPFNGINVALNYTLLRTDGDYGESGSKLSTKDVAKFIPSTANARISYKYGRFSCAYAINYTDNYLETYSVDRAQLLYRKERISMDVSLGIDIKRGINFFITLGNILDEPQVQYSGIASRRFRTIYSGQVLNVGIGGRF